MHACPFDYQLELSTFLSRSPFSKLSDAFSVYFKRREFPSLDPRKRNPSSQIHICSKKNVHLNTSVFNNEKKLSLHHFISYHQSCYLYNEHVCTTLFCIFHRIDITYTRRQNTGSWLVKVKTTNTSHSIHNQG